MALEPRKATLVRAPRDRVWAARTTGTGSDGWFCEGAEVDARPGGRIVFRWRDGGPDRVTDVDGPASGARRAGARRSRC